MIGAVIAMESEAEALLSQMELTGVKNIYGKTVYTGKAFGKDFILCVCGVGKVNAATGTCTVLRSGADVVLNFGVAGGLGKNTQVAELYLVDNAVQYDFDLTQLNGGEVGTLDGEKEYLMPLTLPNLDFPRRTLASGDRFNDSAKDHALLVRLGADLRDMEGAAIAQVCKYAGVPFVSVKAVSDVYGAGSTTEQFKSNLKRAMLNLKAHLGEIANSL